jgi:hypothetical protein
MRVDDLQIFEKLIRVILNLIRAAFKTSIDWRLQVQIAFSTQVNLAPSRPE